MQIPPSKKTQHILKMIQKLNENEAFSKNLSGKSKKRLVDWGINVLDQLERSRLSMAETDQILIIIENLILSIHHIVSEHHNLHEDELTEQLIDIADQSMSIITEISDKNKKLKKTSQ